MSPADRCLALALYAHASQFGPILDEDAEVSTAGQGFDPVEVRNVLARAGFTLRDRQWWNDNAHEYYLEAVDLIASRRAGAEATNRKRWGQRPAEQVAEQVAERVAQHYPSPSPSPSLSVDKGLVVQEPQITLFEPISPPSRPKVAQETAVRFLAARSMRLDGFKPGAAPPAPSKGLLADSTKRIEVLLKQGFDADLLASLPALVADDALDFMLRKDASVLLRVDNPQGGKCHARRYEGQLSGMFLSDRQAAILRNLGTLEYVKGKGAKDRTDAR